MIRLRRASALLVLFWQTAVMAQNYRELPIGGRTATMGGAATAAGNDSAMPYLNPAGMAGVPGDIFALSATVYSYTHRSFKNYFYPRGTPPLLGFRMERESFATDSVGELPSSVMYFKHLDPEKALVRQHVGLALVIPGARQVELVASVSSHLDNVDGEAIETSSISVQSRRYYLGPSYAVAFADRLRLGVSAFIGYQRTIASDALSSSISILGGTTTTTLSGQNSQISQGWAVVPVAGFQVRLVSDLWFGAGVTPPGFPVTGRLRFNSDTSGTSVDPNSAAPLATSQTTTSDLSYENLDPWRLNVGFAFDRRKTWSLAADIHYYGGGVSTRAKGVQRFEQHQAGEVTRRFARRADYTTEVEPVVDFSLGGELAVGRLVSLRAGVFSDLAASKELTETVADYGSLRLDRYGVSLGLGLRLGSFDTTAGVILVRGTGQFGAVDSWISPGVVPIPATETSAMLVLSGAVTVEEAKRTIRETVPFDTQLFPALVPGGTDKPPAPRIPLPLPAEPKPVAPALAPAVVVPDRPVPPTPAPVPPPPADSSATPPVVSPSATPSLAP